MRACFRVAIFALAWLSSGASAASCKHATATSMPSPSKTNSTTKYGPTPNPSVNLGDWGNYKPSKNISLYYGSADEADHGAVHMVLAMLSDAVVLEYIDSIAGVDCGSPDDDAMTVFFNSTEALQEAVADWSDDENLIMITNHFGSCDEEFERGFFLVESLEPSEEDLSVKCVASKRQLSDIADHLELTFSSIPSTTLTKRISFSPSASHTFSKSLPDDIVLFSSDSGANNAVVVTANNAFFTSTVTFSGRLEFSFFGLKAEALDFDIDASLDSNVEVGVDFTSALSARVFEFEPDSLSFHLVDVPGIVKLGPGIGFFLAGDVGATADVDAVAGLGVSMPAANVHIDLLDGDNTAASGWTPEFTSYANISHEADVTFSVSAGVTLELAVDVLGGLLDLSSGVTATPALNNVFSLGGMQVDNETAGHLPDAGVRCEHGVKLKSDFVFDVTGFATKWFKKSLFNTEVPIVEECLEFA